MKFTCSSALIDNWSLELSGTLLENIIEEKNETVLNQVQALFDLLDTIILSDNIIYNSAFAHVWKNKNSLNAIKSLLTGIIAVENDYNEFIVYETIEAKYKEYGKLTYNIQEDLVEHGAKYYLDLASALGVNYWPSPKRAKYIAQQNVRKKDDFLVLLNNNINKEIEKISLKMFESIAKMKPMIFPTFGSRVLSDCEDINSIISTAMQIRNDKYTTEFRKWGEEINSLLEQGNVIALNKEMNSISLLIRDMHKKYSIESDRQSNIKFQIGLSPSVNFEIKIVGSLLEKLMPKKRHLVFLRNHIESSLKNTNTNYQIERLFNIRLDHFD